MRLHNRHRLPLVHRTPQARDNPASPRDKAVMCLQTPPAQHEILPPERRPYRVWEFTRMKQLLRLLAAGAAIAIAAPAFAETFTVTFVQTNDIDRMAAADDRGGFAKLAAVVKAE